jgi:hypothetical protein
VIAPSGSDRETLETVLAACDNRGRWSDRHRGTLNLADDAAVLRGIAQVRHGVIVPLAVPLEATADEQSDVVLLTWREQAALVERLEVEIHGFSVTHVDAVGHNSLFGKVFTGSPVSEAYGATGLGAGSVDALDPVLVRAVLLDVAAASGQDSLPTGTRIGAVDLDRALAAAGGVLEPGDAVVVRTGMPVPRDETIGLDLSAIRWLRHHDVCLYAGDCIEALPSGIDSVPLPLHQIGQARMGLVILDNPDVERLAAACARFGTRLFALSVSPLPVLGGTGSPVAPFAIF